MKERSALAQREAEPGTKERSWLVVTRDETAGDCPDEEAFVALVEDLLVDVPTGEALTIHFHRSGEDFLVDISRASAPGTRTLSDTHQDCAPLANAAATAVALLLDLSPAPSAPPEVPAPKEIPAPEQPERAAPAQRTATLALGLHGAAGLTHFTSSHWSPTAEGEIFVRLGRLGFGVGFVRAFATRHQLGPGELALSQWAAVGRLCGRAVGRPWLALEVCSGLYYGTVKAIPSGFTSNQSQLRPYLAVPVELVLRGHLVTNPFTPGVRVSVGGLIPTHREIFFVEGISDTVQTARFALTATLGIEGVLWWKPMERSF